MSFGKAVLAAFIGGVLAGIFLLAYRVSQQTEKGLMESFVDVPGEAKRVSEKVYVDVRARATDAATRATDAVKHARGSDVDGEGEEDWSESGYVEGGTV